MCMFVIDCGFWQHCCADIILTAAALKHHTVDQKQTSSESGGLLYHETGYKSEEKVSLY